jgi:G3E family GTPase
MIETSLVPVVIVTGFLGAGKTTILNHCLPDPALAGAAVLINELGDVGIDHHLVRDVRGDAVVLASGCVCCTVAGDLVRALAELRAQIARGELPPIDRVILETTGLADPTGVLATLVQHPLLARVYRPGPVVAVVDGVHGADTLARHREATAQVAIADRIVVSKVDLATDDQRSATVAAIVRRNSAAPIGQAAGGAIAIEWLSDLGSTHDRHHGALAAWLRAATITPILGGDPESGRRHHDDVVSAVAIFAQPVRMGPLMMWLSLMTQIHGAALLRVKGIVHAATDGQPMVIHAVQHVVYPPERLATWPDDDHRTRLVFIARGLTAAAVRGLLINLADTLGQALITTR